MNTYVFHSGRVCSGASRRTPYDDCFRLERIALLRRRYSRQQFNINLPHHPRIQLSYTSSGGARTDAPGMKAHVGILPGTVQEANDCRANTNLKRSSHKPVPLVSQRRHSQSFLGRSRTCRISGKMQDDGDTYSPSLFRGCRKTEDAAPFLLVIRA
jgi:hypothetical protein